MIAAVVRSSWAILRRDRAALALSFVVPIVFFSIFATIFGRTGDDPTRRVRVAWVDEDRSEPAARLAEALTAEPALDLLRAPSRRRGETELPAYDRAQATELVRSGQVPAAVVVPEGFGGGALDPRAGRARPRLELLADPADPIAQKMVEGLLQKTILLRGSDLWRTPTEAPSDARPGVVDRLPVEIVVRDLLGEERENSLVAFYAAGLGVMFLMFTAAGAGGALIEERESGTLDRLLATRMSMTGLLAGKLAYLASLGVAQLAVMFTWGWLIFDLELPRHLGGFALMAVPTALAASAFGLVLAALCRTRKQLVAVSNLVILSLSALGGSMFPRYLMPAALQRASLVAFNSWALEGFLDVFWRREPLVATLPEVAVLVAWTAIFFALARAIASRRDQA